MSKLVDKRNLPRVHEKYTKSGLGNTRDQPRASSTLTGFVGR